MYATLRLKLNPVYPAFICARPTLGRTVARSWQSFALLMAVALVAGGCSKAVQHTEISPGPPAAIGELWQEPADIATRDLFHGPGGPELLPAVTDFAFVAADTTGYSPGFDVKDAKGVEWSVKTGPEAQSEVLSSRVLWAIGFHQPPTYYLPKWSLTGTVSGPQEPGRFRPSVAGAETVGDWSWYENPFVGRREYGGLIVANLVLNNWDWKTSNNKIYQLSAPVDGISRRFVVRDLGASLGRYEYPHILKFFRLRGFGQGSRNNIDDFEQQGFIKAATGESVDFDYRGIYRDVIDTVTPADVHWTASRLAKLSDRQWEDAFRAAGYEKAIADRFIAKIKQKVAQGLAVAASSGH
jgi:hypothetical protein